MQLLADMHPSFLRFPGGNYLEGNSVATRFNWKETIHDISNRPGHQDDAWGYWSSDGMGLLEFLEWCEDLHMEPVLAVYAGYSMRAGHIAAGPDLEPFVKDALDEIEYVSGDPSTTWGAQRAADGHPAPFKLEFVEVGNEDNFDRNAGNYDGRFAQFYDAIKAKYPKIQVIATTRVNGRAPDVVDSHLYVSAGEAAMEGHFHDYDNRPRTGPKVFEGEWATRGGQPAPTPNMADALGDAAFLIGMERNSDLVIMESYAPLLVNVSDLRAGRGNGGSMQWNIDLIGYDALGSYGSPSYYVQKMFSLNHGDEVLAATIANAPVREMAQPAGAPRRRRAGDDFRRRHPRQQDQGGLLESGQRRRRPAGCALRDQRNLRHRAGGNSHRPGRRGPQRHQHHQRPQESGPRDDKSQRLGQELHPLVSAFLHHRPATARLITHAATAGWMDQGRCGRIWRNSPNRHLRS